MPPAQLKKKRDIHQNRRALIYLPRMQNTAVRSRLHGEYMFAMSPRCSPNCITQKTNLYITSISLKKLDVS